MLASAQFGAFDLQLAGDYIGDRFATYTNDLKSPGYFTMSGRIGVDIPLPHKSVLRTLGVSMNVTNLTNKKAASTLSIGAAAGTYNFFPLAPRQWFVTLRAGI